MNSAGLIVIAIFGGAMLVLLIAGMMVLGWVLWQAKAAIAELQRELVANGAESKRHLEDSKTQFAAIAIEMNRQMVAHQQETRSQLAGHASLMAAEISKINATALAGASIQAIKACARLELLAVAVEKLLRNVDTSPESTLDPEAYGPTDTIYGTVSDVARGDREAEAEESQDTLSFR